MKRLLTATFAALLLMAAPADAKPTITNMEVTPISTSEVVVHWAVSGATETEPSGQDLYLSGSPGETREISASARYYVWKGFPANHFAFFTLTELDGCKSCYGSQEYHGAFTYKNAEEAPFDGFSAWTPPPATWTPYSSESAFNKEAGSEVAEGSAAEVSRLREWRSSPELVLTKEGEEDWEHPLYYAGAQDPKVELHITSEECGTEAAEVLVT